MTGRSKVILGLVVGAAGVVGIAGVTYMNRITETGGELVQAVAQDRHPVRTLTLGPTDLVETLQTTGVLRANRDIVLTAEVAGKITKVHKGLGDRCQKGEVLLRLDPEGYDIALAQARALEKQARGELKHAERERDRANALRERKVVTGMQADQAQRAADAMEAQVEQASAALRLAERNLRHTVVRCPIAGHVAQRMVDQGQMISQQTPLARLVDLHRLKLELNVTSAQLSRLQVGRPVRVSDPAFPDRSWPAEVARLGVAADAITKTFPVEVVVTSSEGDLRSGQVVRASLELKMHRQALAVPSEAVAIDGDRANVFTVVDGKARQVAVQTGPQIGSQTLVLSGLSAGDQVVAVGREGLKAGAIVEVTGTIEPAGAATPPPAEADDGTARAD